MVYKKNKMKKLIFLFAVSSLFLFSCQKEINKAQWLVGDWEHNSSEGKFTEKWKALNDTTYLGNSYFVIEGDTVFAEEVHLVQKGKEWVYRVKIATEPTDNLTEFKLTSSSKNQLVFENIENDFPKKITYNRIHKDSIFAEISGGGNPQGFPLKRIK